MVKKLPIPFIPSRGFECGQACAAMMIKCFCPDFEPDFEAINKAIHHKQGYYTSPLQLAIFLDRYGIQCRCFSSDDVKSLDEDPNQFRRWFGKDYHKLKKFINPASYNWMVKKGKEKKLFEKRKTPFSGIVELYRKGYLVMLAIDWNTLVGVKGPYQGHFVILSGEDDGKLLIHDPDFGAYLSYDENLLQKAYSHPAISDDVVVAFGRK